MPRARIYRVFPLLFSALVLVLTVSGAQISRAAPSGEAVPSGTVSSIDLIEKPGDYDGRRVLYRGEVVGEILQRGSKAWLVVNDDDYTESHLHRYQELRGGNTGINIHCDVHMVEDIEFTGSYRASGDLVLVEGTFHKANPAHGGDLMIEAERISIVRSGFAVAGRPLGTSAALAVALGALSLLLGALAWKRGKVWERADS